MAKRVVLAYSGGLDTSVAVRWMAEEWGLEVIAVAADVGQGGEWQAIKDRALAAGAAEAVVLDVREEYANDFVAPALKANAKYEGKYPLISSLSRPVIVKRLVEAARTYGADAIAHGCTGKGNDQVRFEVSTAALAPDLEVLAPVRGWGLSREQSIDYAEQWGIPITVTKSSPYSIDQNLWGRTIECGILEDPWEQPPEEVYERPNSAFVARFIGGSNVLTVRHVGDRSVEISGHTLEIGNGDFAGAGRTMAICVKTHDLELLPSPTSVSTNNIVPGVVRGQAYLGSHRDYIVDVGQEVLIAAPPELQIETGASVGVRFRPQRCRGLAR